MKIKILILLTSILLFSGKSYSQSENQSGRLRFICVEASLNSFIGEIENTDKIRADISYFNSNSNNLISSFYKSYVGIKGELRSKNNKFSLLGGLRYTHISSSVGNGTVSSSSFFYFLINSEGTTTEYLRVMEINQRSHYFGIPIELMYFPFEENFFRAYAKIGFEFAYTVQSKTNVVFYDSYERI